MRKLVSSFDVKLRVQIALTLAVIAVVAVSGLDVPTPLRASSQRTCVTKAALAQVASAQDEPVPTPVPSPVFLPSACKEGASAMRADAGCASLRST